jgi:peptidoglycan/LPS O-acetylase OafA/YrhL
MDAVSHRNNFDLIRLLAATQVMFAHSVAWLGLAAVPEWFRPLVTMFPGVAVFYVVSGFLITGSLLREETTILRYLKARALRIYPALWINLLVLLSALWALGELEYVPTTMRFWQWVAAAGILGSNGLGDFFVGPLSTFSGFYQFFPSGVLWTLPIELSFYCFAPIILLRWLQSRWLAGVSVFAWGSWSCWQYATATEIVPTTLPHYLWIFLLGALVQVYWNFVRPIFEGRALYWLLGYLAVAYLAFAAGHRYLFLYHVFTLIGALMNVLMACTVISLAFTARTLTNRLLRGVDISYGLYLWHMPVIWTFVGFGWIGSQWTPLAWLISAAIAAVSWKVVERPALRLRGSGSKVIALPTVTG